MQWVNEVGWMGVTPCHGRGKMSKLACQLNALSSLERGRREELFHTFQAAIVGFAEVDAGYEVSLDPGRVQRNELAELIKLEERCCSFLDFESSRLRDTLVVSITGSEGVKDFLKNEFKLVKPS